MKPKQGPNVRRLISHRASTLITQGARSVDEVFAATVDTLTQKDKLVKAVEMAMADVELYINLVRSSRDNPYKDDEEIAWAILAELAKKSR